MDSLSGSLKHSAVVSPTSPGSPHFFDRATSPHMITKAVQNIKMGMGIYQDVVLIANKYFLTFRG